MMVRRKLSNKDKTRLQTLCVQRFGIKALYVIIFAKKWSFVQSAELDKIFKF